VGLPGAIKAVPRPATLNIDKNQFLQIPQNITILKRTEEIAALCVINWLWATIELSAQAKK
jgi:hypothetical protein